MNILVDQTNQYTVYRSNYFYGMSNGISDRDIAEESVESQQQF